jgi:hypothetical protein
LFNHIALEDARWTSTLEDLLNQLTGMDPNNQFFDCILDL